MSGRSGVGAALLSLAVSLFPLASVAQGEGPLLYILSFNRWGDLENSAERDLAIAELRENSEVDRIILFSYGWSFDGEAPYATYRSILEDITADLPPRNGYRRSAIIAVSWDSSQTGFRKLFNDIIPLPGVANALAWLPDKILFPFSFWSKASQADRIGYGGLRTALNEIFEAVYAGRETPPEIFLIGHSFGTRILSGLMRQRLGFVPVQSEPFVGAEHVKGAVLLQPALAYPNLDTDAEYPILITASAHDHANGLLFPIANVLFNTFSFTAFEALFQRGIFQPFETGVRATMGTVANIVTAPLPDRKKRDEEEQLEGRPHKETKRLGRASYVTRRTLAEILSMPASLAFSLVSAPLTYAYTQVHGLVTHPVDHFMDTLAVLPIVQIPVRWLDRKLEREIRWGQRGKGFLTIGVFHEAMGRMTPARLIGRPTPTYSAQEFLEFDPEQSPCGLPSCEGILVVDATRVIATGSFGQNLENPLVDFTIGWIDIVGAHGDFRDAEVAALMSRVLR